MDVAGGRIRTGQPHLSECVLDALNRRRQVLDVDVRPHTGIACDRLLVDEMAYHVPCAVLERGTLGLGIANTPVEGRPLEGGGEWRILRWDVQIGGSAWSRDRRRLRTRLHHPICSTPR